MVCAKSFPKLLATLKNNVFLRPCKPVQLAVAFLLCFGLPLTASAAISFVQVNSATPQSSPTSLSVTYSSAQVAGDLNIIVAGWNNSTATVSSVTDSKGNTYQLAVGPTALAGFLSQSIYY